MIENLRSIAVFRLSALGDVLMYLPTVRALQRSFPMAKISWIISNPAYELVKNIEGIEFIVIEKPSSLRDYWNLKKRFSQYHFDVLLASQANFRAHLIYPLIKAKRKIGYDSIRAQEGHRWVVGESIPFQQVHTLEGFLQFAQHIGADTSQVEWNFPIDAAAEAWVKAFLQEHHMVLDKPFIVINPAASKVERSWNSEGYVQLIKFLQTSYRAQIILVGGPSAFDRKLANDILSQVQVLDLVGKTKLMELMAVIEKANLVICPDTGPSHMAACLNTPVIALHGVTKPEISGPYHQLHHTVNRYPLAKQKFYKKPLFHRRHEWFEKVHHPDVMSLITVQDVIEKVKQLLD
jgi:heptosyltransferase I